MANPLNVVVLLGSLRKGSYNRIIAQSLAGLAPADMSVTLLPSIGTFPLYDADLQAQGIPAVVTEMGDAIRKADGIIIVTPEYNYSIPGGLKNAIDWFSRLSEQPFAGKPLAIQSASMGAIGGARAQYHLRQTLVFLDAHILNKPEVMVGVVQNKVNADKGTLEDEDTRKHIAGQLQSFADFIRRLG